MSDELDSLSDAELSERFAHEVAGWVNQGCAKNIPAFLHKWKTNNANQFWDTRIEPLPFATSADSIIPFLPKTYGGSFWTADAGFLGCRISIRDQQGEILHEASSPILARSACIALLRSKRSTIK